MNSHNRPLVSFDTRALWKAVEAKRVELGLSPTALIRSINWLSASVLARYKRGERANCQFVNGVLRWLGRSAESFVSGMVDGPECEFPYFGPYAVRWNMAALWESLDEKRSQLGITWEDTATLLGWPQVESLRLEWYGIDIDPAMRIVHWLGKPAASFMYAAEPSPAKPGSAAFRPETANEPFDSLADIYSAAVRGKSDQEIEAFARRSGGFPSICRLVVIGIRWSVLAHDCEVGIILDDGQRWTIRVKDGKNSYKPTAGKAAALLHASPPDFLRIAFQDFDWKRALADARVNVDGDFSNVERLFGIAGN